MHTRTFYQKFAFGVSGQATFRAATGLGTLLVIPALIHGWGVRGYGEWIALTAMTSYMSYSNFGVVSTSMNEMIMASGAGDHQRAARVFQMSINLTIYIIAPVLFLVAALMIFTPAINMMKFSTIGNIPASWIVILVGVQVWFLTVRGIVIAVLYANGSYGFVYYLLSGTKLAEVVMVSVGASMFGLKPIAAAAIMSGMALFEVVVVAIIARRSTCWMRIDLSVFDLTWVAVQAKPALGFLLGNFATQGILLQGSRIMLSMLLGGGAVAIYAIYGTAMRLIDQILLIMVLPLEVEIARSIGRSDTQQTRRLVVVGTQISWILFVGVAAFLLLLGPIVFHWWTDGRIAFSLSMMALYLCMSASNLLGRVSAHALIGTNSMYGPSFAMVGAAVLAVALGSILTIPLKIAGMLIGGIAGELADSLIAIYAVAMLLDISILAKLRELLDLGKSRNDVRQRLVTLLARWKSA